MPARMRIYCLLLLVAATGCATAGKRPLFARPSKVQPEPASESTRSEDENEDEERSEREPLVAGRKGSPGPVDPELQRRIENQLLALAPDQRAAWRAQLNGLSPAQQLRALEGLNSQPQRTQVAQADERPAPAHVSGAAPVVWTPGHSPLGGHSGATRPAVVPAHQPFVAGSGAAAGPDASGDFPGGDAFPATPNGVLPASNVDPAATSAESDAARPRRFPVISDWDKSLTWLGQRETADPALAPEAKPSLFGLPQVLVPHVPGRGEPATPAPQPVPQAVIAPPTANLAPITAESKVWEDELRKLVSLLEADATVLRPGMSQAEQREYLRRQIALRMLYLVENEPERAQQVIAGIPETEQEFWTSLFWGLSSYVDDASNADPAMRATMTIDQLRAAIHHLQAKAHLQLSNLTFCHGIRGFGNYDQYDDDRFSPGQSVLLYCEVRNFASEQTRSNDFRSQMKSAVEIFRDGEANQLVSRTQFDPTEDRSRTPRGDYYHSYRIDLPRHLSPGRYVLKLTVEDQVSTKLAVESIAFEIH